MQQTHGKKAAYGSLAGTPDGDFARRLSLGPGCGLGGHRAQSADSPHVLLSTGGLGREIVGHLSGRGRLHLAV